MIWRNFDNRDRYSDLHGKPLHGCVQFMPKDGNTPLTVFDSDGTPLSNPIVTDILGRTEQQVFVNSDVIAYMYKYIGNGRLSDEESLGIDTTDETKWALQYTVESSALDSLVIEGTTAMGVSDMASLRALDPDSVPLIDGTKIVTLYGYYEAGDKEPIDYIYDGESELQDDNGSVIKPDDLLTGRWFMVRPTEHCDSRHFGVFPQDSSDVQLNQSTAITQLVDYCNAKSLKPFFNGSESYPYFVWGTLTINSRNPIDISSGTVFVDRNTTVFYGEIDRNSEFRFLNSNTTVDSKSVRLSWHTGNHVSTHEFIVDTDAFQFQVSDTLVVFEVSPAYGSQLTRCTVESSGVINSAVTMNYIEIHDSWFSPSYNWQQLTIYGCKILLDNCTNADIYVLLKNKQIEANYGDLNEQTVTGATLLPGCIAENATFSGVTIQGQTELHNVSGTVAVSGSSLELNAVDCWLTWSSPAVTTSVSLRRGGLAGSDLKVLSVLYLDGVGVTCQLDCRGATASIANSSISAPMSCTTVTITRTDISSTVTQYAVGQVIDFLVESCRFLGAGQHVLTSATANTTVSGRWLNNTGLGNVLPINVVMTNINGNDNGHTYKYEGNTGSFLPRYPKRTWGVGNFARYYDGENIVSDTLCYVEANTVIPAGINYPISCGVWVPESWSAPALPFFSIGNAVCTWRMAVSWEFAQTDGVVSSSDPKRDFLYELSATRNVTVADPINYDCSSFNGKYIGPITIAPRNPETPPLRNPDFSPVNFSCNVTYERLR